MKSSFFPSGKKRIYVLSISYNSCISDSDSSLDEKEFIDSNKYLIEGILERIKQHACDEVIIHVGGSLQSLDAIQNAAKMQPHLKEYLPRIQKIFSEIKKRINIPCRFDPFLLCDLFDKKKEKVPQWINDVTKVTTLFAQMHRLAKKNPEADIIFDFCDGKKQEVLERLLKFYGKNHNVLMPTNVNLNLLFYRVNSIGVSQIASIKRESFPSIHIKDYKEFLVKLADICQGNTFGQVYPYSVVNRDELDDYINKTFKIDVQQNHPAQQKNNGLSNWKILEALDSQFAILPALMRYRS